MDKSLISQVSFKEDFILFKNCFIDLGKIAFVEEHKWPRREWDKFGCFVKSKVLGNMKW